MRRALPLLLLAASGVRAADRPASDAPVAGLHLPPARVLERGKQSLAAQVILQGNYPLWDLAIAEGTVGGLELDLHGLFHHQRIDGFGTSFRYDFDEFQGGVRWGPSLALPGRSAVATAAGFSRMYARHKYSDGRYSFFVRRYWWGEAIAETAAGGGARVAFAERHVREVETKTDIDAVMALVELPPLGGVSLLGEAGHFLRNPFAWHRPWAAGARLGTGNARVYLYTSNTWGTTVADSLYGAPGIFYNLRLALTM
jgi:hypothetical protein